MWSGSVARVGHVEYRCLGNVGYRQDNEATPLMLYLLNESARVCDQGPKHTQPTAQMLEIHMLAGACNQPPAHLLSLITATGPCESLAICVVILCICLAVYAVTP